MDIIKVVKFLLFLFLGIISTAGILDRETQALYILDVRAHIKDADPSMNSLSQVVVMITDENDNTPTFDQEEYKVNAPSCNSKQAFLLTCHYGPVWMK